MLLIVTYRILEIRFRVVISDRPGGISDLTKAVGDVHASIKDISMASKF